MSKSYAVELINVSTPDGDKIFITNRFDNRSESKLAIEVPEYFENKRKLQGAHRFISRIYLADGLTFEQGEEALVGFLAVYRQLGFSILNSDNSIGRNRPLVELFAV
jgi:hypothetical protein